MTNNDELRIKIILLGNGHVGKTSLATRFAKNTFSENYQPSIGVDFMIKFVEHDKNGIYKQFMITIYISTLNTQMINYRKCNPKIVRFKLTTFVKKV